MLDNAAELGESSGIDVICEKRCLVLGGSYWKTILESTHDSIIFIDEENGKICQSALNGRY